MRTLNKSIFCILVFGIGITSLFAQPSATNSQTDYKIITGRLEKGSPKQKSIYAQLFGAEDIQQKFDFYFHWYNIAHEYGHCILDFNNKGIGGAKEEIIVNKYAVCYWRQAGFDKELIELRDMLENALTALPNPVPEGKTFTEWYTDIWGSPQLMTVPIYGYFQFKSVLIAMEDAEDLQQWFAETEIEGLFRPDSCVTAKYPIESNSASKYLDDMQRYLKKSGVKTPFAEIELTDNPMTHCSKRLEQNH